MKKFYRIVLLLALFIFLTTYTPSGLNVFPKKTNLFFEIQNIEIVNNHIINKEEIDKKLANILRKEYFVY